MSTTAPTSLTVREHTTLGLEARRWKYEGAKASAAHTELGYSSTRYYQVLNALVDRPEALAAYPQLVRRLQRLREVRRRARCARRLGYAV